MSRSHLAFIGFGCSALFSVASFAEDQLPPSHNVPLPRLALVSAAPKRPTLETRWERFDAEFGIHEEQSSLFAASLMRAKYGLDVACFSLKTFSETLSDMTELCFSHGRIRRASTTVGEQPSLRSSQRAGPIAIEDARLKFDFGLTGSKPYLGVRVVLPFGN